MPSKDNERQRLRKSGYKTKYPYNKVMITEKGHEVHYDDTPGEERIRIAHKDGTYDEINVGGHRTSYTVGNKQEYNKSGVTITVDENNDVKIHGHDRFLIGGGGHVEVTGDSNITVGGDANIVTGGNSKVAVAGDTYLGGAGHLNVNIAGNMNLKVAGTTTMESGGDTTIKAANIHLNP